MQRDAFGASGRRRGGRRLVLLLALVDLVQNLQII
jgi:hypothetical protein